jgi:hypothetical protein
MERPLPAAAGDPFAAVYERRRPEEAVLYRTVQAELGSFVGQARRRDRPLPHFSGRSPPHIPALRISAPMLCTA